MKLTAGRICEGGWKPIDRCFAFFHPALSDDPVIFVEVALSDGLTGDLEPLLDIKAPLLQADKADTAIFYSINNCLQGLRGIPFGNFLIKQVVSELAAELPRIKTYATLSPLPRFSKALVDSQNENGFTKERLGRLVEDYALKLTRASGRSDPVDALFHLLKQPLSHRNVLAPILERLALCLSPPKRMSARSSMIRWRRFTFRMARVWKALMHSGICGLTELRRRSALR